MLEKEKWKVEIREFSNMWFQKTKQKFHFTRKHSTFHILVNSLVPRKHVMCGINDLEEICGWNRKIIE